MITTSDPEKQTQNKPNSKPISEMLKMNVGSVKTRDYENKRLCRLRENKPKTNPIKPNFKGKKEKDVATKAQRHEEKMLSSWNKTDFASSRKGLYE